MAWHSSGHAGYLSILAMAEIAAVKHNACNQAQAPATSASPQGSLLEMQIYGLPADLLNSNLRACVLENCILTSFLGDSSVH